jgi:hypothetical protein
VGLWLIGMVLFCMGFAMSLVFSPTRARYDLVPENEFARLMMLAGILTIICSLVLL